MDVDRLNAGEKIAAVSAVLLFVFMFFDWFTVEAAGGAGLFGGGVGRSAWDALDVIPVFLVIAIAAAVAVAVIRLTDAAFEPEISINAVVAVLGGLAVLLILFRIVDPPGVGGVPGLSVDVSPAVGIFLGLLAAAGIAYGGYRAMQEEGASFAEIGERLSTKPPPPPTPPSSGPGGPPAQ